MTSEIFVSRLSYETTSDGLREAFEKYGTVVRAEVIVDRQSGRSTGTGYVEFANPSEASDAYEGMIGEDIDGRSIHVEESSGDRRDRRDGRDGRHDSHFRYGG